MLIVNTEAGGSRLNLLAQCTPYLHRDKGENNMKHHPDVSSSRHTQLRNVQHKSQAA